MNHSQLLAGAAVSLLLLCVVATSGAQSSSTADSATTYVKDSDITMKVKAKLAAEHVMSLTRIHVETDTNGIVYLSGTAKDQMAIDKAIGLARGTDRVTDVRSEITVATQD